MILWQPKQICNIFSIKLKQHVGTSGEWKYPTKDLTEITSVLDPEPDPDSGGLLDPDPDPGA